MKRCPQCGKDYSDDANFCPVDAGRLEVIEGAASDGHVLGARFTIGERIGGGFTGDVYKAKDSQTGHVCAVKIVDAKVFATPLLMQRTERELKQLERLEAHGAARILDHGRDDDRLWIAQELVAGTALDKLSASVGPMPPERAVKLVHGIGTALAEAAKLGVIHRDVAPKNVLVESDDDVKVINFGVAASGSSGVAGIPEFVAPEQVDGKPVDQRSNIYSLGALLYYLLTGKPVFEGDAETVHQAHLVKNPPVPSQNGSICGADIDHLVLKALEKASSKRFMTLRQLLSGLEKLLGADPSSTQPMAPAGKPKDVPAAKAGDSAHTLLGVSAFKNADPVPDAPTSETSTPVAAVLEAARDSVVPASAAADLAPPMAGNVSFGEPSAAQPSVSGEVGPSVQVSADASAPAAAEPEAAQPAQPAAVDEGEDRPTKPLAAEVPQEVGRTTGKRSRKRKKKKKKNKSGDKFRETMWFKKGALDEAAAEAAASAKPDELASSKADMLPIEDRYDDDGSLDERDQNKFSLKTGATQMMNAMSEGDDDGSGSEVSAKELVSEMRAGRGKVIGLIILALVVLGVVIFLVTKG